MTYSSLSVYKQQILNDFNNRTFYENEFHRRVAIRLVEWAKLQPGQQVLDVATGTGLAAIAAAQVVGSTAESLGCGSLLQTSVRREPPLRVCAALRVRSPLRRETLLQGCLTTCKTS